LVPVCVLAQINSVISLLKRYFEIRFTQTKNEIALKHVKGEESNLCSTAVHLPLFQRRFRKNANSLSHAGPEQEMPAAKNAHRYSCDGYRKGWSFISHHSRSCLISKITHWVYGACRQHRQHISGTWLMQFDLKNGHIALTDNEQC